MDLSKLSTEDLLALRDNDLSRVSTEGLKYLQTQLNPPKQAGFLESFAESAGILKAAPAAARFAAAQTPEEKEAARRELLEKTKSEYETTSFADIKDLPSAIDWAAQVAGGSAGALAAPALAGLAAGPVGLTAALGTQYTTSALARQAQEQEAALARGETPEETSVGKAVVAAAGQTALDRLGFKFFQPVFSKFPGLSKLFSPDEKAATEAAQTIIDAAQAGKYSIKNGVFKGVAGGVAFEVPQEIAQSVLDRWQAGLSVLPTDPDARAEYYESAAGAVLLGGTLGAGSGFMQNRAKLKQAEELQVKAREQREAAQRTAAEAAEAEAEAEKEAQRKQKAEKTEDEKAKSQLELEKAAEVARKVGTETEENAIRNELMAVMGLDREGAIAQIRRLKQNRILSYDRKTGLHTVQEAAPEVVQFDPTARLEPVTSEAKEGQQEVPVQAATAVAAAPAPATAAKTEEVRPDVIETGTEGPVEGADTRGAAGVVSGSTAAGPGTAGPELSGVGRALDVSDVSDAGKEAGAPALTAAPEVAAPTVTLDDRKASRKATLDDLTTKLNALRQTVSETADDDTVVDVLNLAASLEKTYEQFNKLPKNLTAKYGDKEAKLDAQITLLDKKISRIQELTTAQARPIKSEKELAAELRASEAEAQTRARREEAGALSQEEQVQPVTAQFENELRKGVNNALDFVDRATAESVAAVDTAPARDLMGRMRKKPEVAEADALVEDVANTVAQNVKSGKDPELARVAGEAGRVNKDWARRLERNMYDVVSGLTSVLREKVNFKDSNVQIEGDANADPNVFTRLRKENKLAEYDPKTNTFYFAKDGLNRRVFLHEAVHAATVKILRAYETNPASLTKSQREAAEHIGKIYAEAKKRLGGKYRDAFENIYEFVSEVATNRNLQRDMSKIVRPNLAKYTKRITNLWDQFTEALARMFGIDSRKGEKPTSIQIEGVDESGKKVKAPIPGLSTFIPAEPGYRGNLLLEASRALQYILSSPERVEGVAPLPARRSGRRLRAAPDPNATEEELLSMGLTESQQRAKNRAILKGKKQFLWGREGYEKVVKTVQDDRRVVDSRENMLTKAGKSVFAGPNINTVGSQIALSSGQAYHNFMTRWEGAPASLKQSMDKINTAVYDYAKALNVTSEQALNDLSMMLAAKHEPERRFVKFLLNAPLSNDSKDRVRFGGIEDTPAGMRDRILKELYRNTDKDANGNALLSENGTVAAMRRVLEELVGYQNGVKVGNGYIDTVNGVRTNETKPTAASGDINSEEYDVIGALSKNNIKTLTDRLNRLSQPGEATSAPIEALTKAMRDYQEASKYLDRQANYWSVPVDNITKLYNFQNYVPLKGYGGTEVSKGDDRFEIGKRLGGEYLETPFAFEGRQTLPDNVVAQTLVDGTRAAMRSARKDVTLALVNYQKFLNPNAKPLKVIPFSERYKGIADLKAEKGDYKIFHYRPDGAIEIWEIRDKEYLRGVRRMYEQSNPYWDFANRITSGIGHLHTRYNPAFYPYNFVRDTLTNAFTLGAELGPARAWDYIKAVSADVAKNKFSKAHKISRLYSKGDVDAIKRMAEKDPFTKDMLRFLELGGRVSYIQGLALEGQLETLQRQVSQNKFAIRGETVNRWIDAWADMFEFTSRVSAFRVMRDQLISEGASKEDAETRAAAYAKNLANFEKVGEIGRKAGALFMFFRPAATGAVRAIDSLMPLFENLESAVKRLPDAIRQDPQAVETFRKNHLRQREAAKTMLLSVAGAGAAIYTMALMGSDDDEMGRNRVQTDDMALWSRNIRLPLSIIGKEGYLQIPWGFGIGAFAAAGAQFAGAAAGPTNVRDMAGNLVTILLDSYIPIPVSRINPLENPGAWALDSMMPSTVRPVLEFMMNVDGLGREIYNNRMSKYGDAYTGGRNTPLIFKDASDILFRITNGEVQVSPDTLYFFANNYVDGVSRVLASGYGLGYTLEGTKDFNAKEDFILISSFLGRQANFDAREFASVEKKIEKHQQTLNAMIKQAEFSKDDSAIRRYLERYPNAYMMVQIHNKVVNGDLKEIREVSRAIQSDRTKTPKEKKEAADQLNLLQNIYKRRLIDLYKNYGLEP